MTPAEKKQRVREIFASAQAHKVKADKLAMELLYHPDATEEHLTQLRRTCLQLDSMLAEVVTKARDKYPRMTYTVREKWDAPEFDRFYRPKK